MDNTEKLNEIKIPNHAYIEAAMDDIDRGIPIRSALGSLQSLMQLPKSIENQFSWAEFEGIYKITPEGALPVSRHIRFGESTIEHELSKETPSINMDEAPSRNKSSDSWYQEVMK